ncbi:hypothetical protein ENBRE01_0952 [Enteropsectra breve]|nr:hypothetical protein ENBRE01_0952 [Enteropsectra breve]
MQRNNDPLQSLAASPISACKEEYLEAINGLSKNNYKQLLNTIIQNNDSNDDALMLLHAYLSSLSAIEVDGSTLLSSVLSTILRVSLGIPCPASLLFCILQNYCAKKHEDIQHRVLEYLKGTEFGSPLIIELLYKPECAALASSILNTREDLVDEFLRTVFNEKNQVLLKNAGSVIASLPPEHFVNYKSFFFFLSNENYSIRISYLEIMEKLVTKFKNENNIDAVTDITLSITENLLDTNYYVRTKVLGIISNMFIEASILKEQRNKIIGEIIGRIEDKTVLVRKKAIAFLAQILINHPFKNKKQLVKNLEAANSDNSNFENDFNEFVRLMEDALEKMISILSYNLKTDLVEIADFIKEAYLLGVRNSREGIQKMMGFVFTKEKEVVLSMFRDIVCKKEEILYEFTSDRAFEAVLESLDLDEKILLKKFFKGEKIYEAIYVLKQLNRPISESVAQSLLDHATALLFHSENEKQLMDNVELYTNVLSIIKNMSERLQHEHSVLKTVGKNILKMKFYEASLVKCTVELFYSVSLNPEKNITKLFKNLILVKSTLKLVDCVGWVAFCQFMLLERLEGKYKKGGMSQQLAGALRKSIDCEDMAEVRERRMSLESTKRNSLSGYSKSFRASLKFNELEDSMKDKTDEEINGFFFYIKEEELLYSPNCLLQQFVPLVMSSLSSDNLNIQVAAYSTLNKLMLISFKFFSQHFEVFKSSLYHTNAAVKNNAVAALHDLIIYYNTSIDVKLVFGLLADPDIKKNAVLVIYSLMQKNVVKMRNNSVRLVEQVHDEEIGPIIIELLKFFSSNNNITSIIFYEVYQSKLPLAALKIVAKFVAQNIQEPLFLKCLKNCHDAERLRAVYDEFSLSEKFISDNGHLSEMQALSSKKQ